MNRRTLKNFFKRGSLPTEVNFADLIDSTLNKVDDGISKNIESGLMISPTGTSNKLMSFYNNIKDKNPAWNIGLNEGRTNGLVISEGEGKPRLFIQNGGNVGIGTMTPQAKLEVNGMVAMQGRIGTFKKGKVPADGKWHTIIGNLDYMQAFEIMSYVQAKQGRGKYAMLHAIAVSTFGGPSHSAITQTAAYYRYFWNRLNIRWSGDIHNYSLQIRTASNYGFKEDGLQRMITYRITQLWDERDEEREIDPEIEAMKRMYFEKEITQNDNEADKLPAASSDVAVENMP
ncbi:MAG: hypothetical protein AB8B69_21075 [Chitinophagales bacterium]